MMRVEYGHIVPHLKVTFDPKELAASDMVRLAQDFSLAILSSPVTGGKINADLQQDFADYMVELLKQYRPNHPGLK